MNFHTSMTMKFEIWFKNEVWFKFFIKMFFLAYIMIFSWILAWILKTIDIFHMNDDVLCFMCNIHVLHFLILFYFCIFLYISWIVFCEAFFHLYSLQNEVDCSRMHVGFVLLTMSEKFTKWFLIKYIFEAILCLSFDIHHNIHQTFVTTISHSPPNLKVIVWVKQACTITSTK
jgi:hypothetical protein